MTPQQYVVDNYPGADASHIQFFLNGYNYSRDTIDFEDIWDSLPRIDKEYYIQDYIDAEALGKYDSIDEAWDDITQADAMRFLKDKVNNLSIYELYQIMHNRIEELINEHQLMTTI